MMTCRGAVTAYLRMWLTDELFQTLLAVGIHRLLTPWSEDTAKICFTNHYQMSMLLSLESFEIDMCYNRVRGKDDFNTD